MHCYTVYTALGYMHCYTIYTVLGRIHCYTIHTALCCMHSYTICICCVRLRALLNCIYCIRLSVDSVFQQVKQMENKVSGLEKRMVKAPEDMKTQMEKFFNASCYADIRNS